MVCEILGSQQSQGVYSMITYITLASAFFGALIGLPESNWGSGETKRLWLTKRGFISLLILSVSLLASAYSTYLANLEKNREKHQRESISLFTYQKLESLLDGMIETYGTIVLNDGKYPKNHSQDRAACEVIYLLNAESNDQATENGLLATILHFDLTRAINDSDNASKTTYFENITNNYTKNGAQISDLLSTYHLYIDEKIIRSFYYLLDDDFTKSLKNFGSNPMHDNKTITLNEICPFSAKRHFQRIDLAASFLHYKIRELGHVSERDEEFEENIRSEIKENRVGVHKDGSELK